MIYTGDAGLFSDLGKCVTQTEQALTEFHDRFDVIVASGVSGIVVASPVCLELDIPLVIVRKKEDHNGHHLGGEILNAKALDGKRYLILDDFVCSGRTIEYIKDRVANAPLAVFPWMDYAPAKYVGTYEYSEDCFLWEPRDAV